VTVRDTVNSIPAPVNFLRIRTRACARCSVTCTRVYGRVYWRLYWLLARVAACQLISSHLSLHVRARVYLDADGGIFDQDGGMDEDQGMFWTRMEACWIKTSSSVSPIQNSGSNRDKASCPSLPSCISSSYVTTFSCNYYRRAKLE
jgi:hypothetical protein